MKSLKQLAQETENQNVLLAIRQAALGYETILMARHLPQDFAIDVTLEELQPEFLRVAKINKDRIAGLPTHASLMNKK